MYPDLNKIYIIIMSTLLTISIWGLKIIFDSIREEIKNHKKKFDIIDKRLDGHDIIIDRIVTTHNNVDCPSVRKIENIK